MGLRFRVIFLIILTGLARFAYIGVSVAPTYQERIIERNNLRESLPPTITTFGRGVGGEVRMPIGRASALELGKLKLERLVTAFPSNGWFGEQGKAGNIGSAVLRRFKVIFDYSRGRMILEPNKFFSDAFEHDMSGLHSSPKARHSKSFASTACWRNRPPKKLESSKTTRCVGERPSGCRVQAGRVA